MCVVLCNLIAAERTFFALLEVTLITFEGESSLLVSRNDILDERLTRMSSI